MAYDIRQFNNEFPLDVNGVLDILDYYAKDSEHTAAEFRDKEDRNLMIKVMDFVKKEGYPFYVADTFILRQPTVIGFGYLFPHGDYGVKPLKRSANWSIYVHPNYRHQHIGTQIFEKILTDKRIKAIGIDNIMASTSSWNNESIEFHKSLGFKECGTFVRAGRKFDSDFDIIWMQRLLS